MEIVNLKLDTTSEYVMDASKWPKPICDVMVECDTLIDMAKFVFGKEDGDGYVDIYAMIDPERRFVTEFLVIFKDLDGSEEDITIKVTDIADQVDYFKTLERQGGKDFMTFITEACWTINSERMSSSAAMVEVVEDFLEERDIRIPSSDAEMIAAGDSPENNSSRIYGPDYDELVNGFEEAQGLSPQAVIRDRINALSDWAMKYNPDEVDFYTELSEFSLYDLERVCGKTDTEIIKKYCEDHGIEIT